MRLVYPWSTRGESACPHIGNRGGPPTMASSLEKPLDHRYRGEHPIRTLAYLFRADRRRLAAAVAVFTVKHSPIWLLPLITASIIDTVVQHQPVSRLWTSVGVILFILLINYPLHVLYVRLLYGSVRRMGTGLRSALCTRMQQLSIGYHSRVSAGVLQAKVVRDVETVEQMVQQTAETGLGATTVLIGGLVIIAVRTPEFVPVFLVVVPAAALVVARLRARLRTHNEHFRHEVETLSSRVTEMTRLIPVTRAHGLENKALRRMDGTLRRLLTSGNRLDLVNGRFGSLAWVVLNVVGVLVLTAAALVSYYGVWGVTMRRRRHAQRLPDHPHQLHDHAGGPRPRHHQGPGIRPFRRRTAPGARTGGQRGQGPGRIGARGRRVPGRGTRVRQRTARSTRLHPLRHPRRDRRPGRCVRRGQVHRPQPRHRLHPAHRGPHCCSTAPT